MRNKWGRKKRTVMELYVDVRQDDVDTLTMMITTVVLMQVVATTDYPTSISTSVEWFSWKSRFFFIKKKSKH
jgi:hypothetical protein